MTERETGKPTNVQRHQDLTRGAIRGSLKWRRIKERSFRAVGLIAIMIPVVFLLVMLGVIIYQSSGAFQRTAIALDIHFDEQTLDPAGTRDRTDLSYADYGALVSDALRRDFPHVGDEDFRQLTALMSAGARFKLREMVIEDPGMIGETRTLWLPADDDVDIYFKGDSAGMTPERGQRLSDRQIAWLNILEQRERIRTKFNTTFFTGADLPEPELAGIWGAVVGSFFALATCFLLSFPIGVLSAIFLEEFAPKRRWVEFIEININNLAAVPSIVFGLLGLAVFLNFAGLPRSAPFVGGLVLALMTLPTIIIASRAAIRAVPTSVRHGALGLGASRMQMVFHHVVPMAMPGVMTGTIIGLAQALGETAPLLMIGMVAFVGQIPDSFLDPAVALPVQIFMWAGEPERAFTEKAAAAIVVMLSFLIVMNLTSIFLRQKFEQRM